MRHKCTTRLLARSSVWALFIPVLCCFVILCAPLLNTSLLGMRRIGHGVPKWFQWHPVTCCAILFQALAQVSDHILEQKHCRLARLGREFMQSQICSSSFHAADSDMGNASNRFAPQLPWLWNPKEPPYLELYQAKRLRFWCFWQGWELA